MKILSTAPLRGPGLDALRELTAEGRAPRTTVALTGHDDPATEARCLAAGCRAVLGKPVRAATLLAGLREWVGEGGAHITLCSAS